MTRLRLLGLLYLVAGLGLAGWLVNLGRSLNDHSVAHHLPAVKGAVGGLLVLHVLVALVVDTDTSAPTTGRTGLAVTVTGVATEWFLLLPGAATRPFDVVFAAIVGVTVIVAVLISRDQFPRRRRRASLVACLVALTLSTVAMVLGSEPTVLGSHQRLVWVGLDVAEAGSVLLTGIRLVRGRAVSAPATCAGSLFLLDATINIGVASGAAEGAAWAMAGLEVPAAVLSFVIARRTPDPATARRQASTGDLRPTLDE